MRDGKYTVIKMGSTVEAGIKGLRSKLISEEGLTDKVFEEALRQGIILLELDCQVQIIADALHVSRLTVVRWSQGRNLPTISLRRPILVQILKMLEAKLVEQQKVDGESEVHKSTHSKNVSIWKCWLCRGSGNRSLFSPQYLL